MATTLNAIDGFLLTARTFRNRVTNLIKKFSYQNKSEGEKGIGIYVYWIWYLLQGLVDLSRDSDAKQEQITEQKKALAGTDKQKALDIRDMAKKNLKKSQQVLKDGPSSEKRSRRSSSETFSFLREKLEYDKEFREKELKLKKEERKVSRCDDSTWQQRQSNEVLRIFTLQSQAHSEQQTMMQQQIHALRQQKQQLQIFM